MGNILKVSNLSKNYGNLQVINGWDIELEEGEKVVLVGPSGCGKQLFFRIISGLEKRQVEQLMFLLKSRIRISGTKTFSLAHCI